MFQRLDRCVGHKGSPKITATPLFVARSASVNVEHRENPLVGGLHCKKCYRISVKYKGNIFTFCIEKLHCVYTVVVLSCIVNKHTIKENLPRFIRRNTSSLIVQPNHTKMELSKVKM